MAGPINPSPATQYSITGESLPVVGGFVTGNALTAAAGQAISLVAKSNAGYHFSGWTNCPSAVGSTCNVTADSDLKVIANFTQNVCAPNVIAKESCPIENGSGTRSRLCNSVGSSYGDFGACSITSCNATYELKDGVCKPRTTIVTRLFKAGRGRWRVENGSFKVYLDPSPNRVAIYRCLSKDNLSHFVSTNSKCSAGNRTEGLLSYLANQQLPGHSAIYLKIHSNGNYLDGVANTNPSPVAGWIVSKVVGYAPP